MLKKTNIKEEKKADGLASNSGSVHMHRKKMISIND